MISHAKNFNFKIDFICKKVKFSAKYIIKPVPVICENIFLGIMPTFNISSLMIRFVLSGATQKNSKIDFIYKKIKIRAIGQKSNYHRSTKNISRQLIPFLVNILESLDGYLYTIPLCIV